MVICVARFGDAVVGINIEGELKKNAIVSRVVAIGQQFVSLGFRVRGDDVPAHGERSVVRIVLSSFIFLIISDTAFIWSRETEERPTIVAWAREIS
jgi:hypothetical protein